MGNPAIEVTEEKQDAAQTEKLKAMDAISEGMSVMTCVHIGYLLHNWAGLGLTTWPKSQTSGCL